MKTLITLALALIVALAGITSCTTNPATGKKDFNFFSDPKQEIAMGVQAEPQFIQEYGGEIPSPRIRQYVSDLGQRLAAVSERRDLPWEYHVVDSDEINAFALPGGKVFVSRGLLARLTNEAQLAGVLGHETGHVNAQHIGQQMSRAAAAQGAITLLGVAAEATNKDYLRVLGVGAQAGSTVYLLKFSRDQESQADELGVRYMTRLGYNPIAQIQVMEILKAAAGAGGGLEMLSTHPLPQTRIDRLNKLIKQKFPDYDQPGKYRLNADAYRANVLDVLRTLPPARNHGGPSASGGGKQLRGR